MPSASLSSSLWAIRAAPWVTLRVTNSRPRRGDSWLKRMPDVGAQVVALAVVDGDPVAVDLGHAVGAAGIERRRLALGHFLHLAEHLRRAGLIEAGLGVDEPDGVEQPRHPHGGGLPREDGLVPRRLHERLGGQVVDLGRPVIAQDVDQGDLVEQVPRDQLDPVLDVRDALEVQRARAPDHTDDGVPLVEEELGQVRPVLAGDAGDQCPLGHRGRNYPRAGPVQCRACPRPAWSRSAWAGATGSP